MRWVVKKMMCGVAVLLLAACSSSTEPDVNLDGAFVTGPVEVTLQHGEEQTIPGTVLRVSFAEVLEDSRCPTDVVCVWEGNAVVEIGISAGTGPTHALQVNTSLDPRWVDWNQVRVTLLELTPAPVSTQVIDAQDYVVKLRLEPTD